MKANQILRLRLQVHPALTPHTPAPLLNATLQAQVHTQVMQSVLDSTLQIHMFAHTRSWALVLLEVTITLKVLQMLQ